MVTGVKFPLNAPSAGPSGEDRTGGGVAMELGLEQQTDLKAIVGEMEKKEVEGEEVEGEREVAKDSVVGFGIVLLIGLPYN